MLHPTSLALYNEVFLRQYNDKVGIRYQVDMLVGSIDAWSVLSKCYLPQLKMEVRKGEEKK